MVSRANGIWTSGARGKVDHWRRAIAENARSDEPEDQVSGELSTLCPQRLARTSQRLVRTGLRKPVHAAGGSCGKSEATRNDGKRAEIVRDGEAADASLDYPGG